MRNKLVIFILLLFAIIIYFLFLNTNNPKNKIHFILGICVHGNFSHEIFALNNGIKYFRTDMFQNKTKENEMYYEYKNYNASYLGILDYDSLPNGYSNKNWNLSLWNESINNITLHYNWIKEWEIWNEPYLQRFQTGFMNGSAYNYFLLIKSSYFIIKKNDPNASIICFGGAPIGDYNTYLWYKEVWSYGAYNYCNAISLHVYPNPNVPLDSYFSEVKYYLYLYENLTKKPIYITETGMPSSFNESLIYLPVSQEVQANYMLNMLDFFNNFSFIKGVYWYDLYGLSDGNLNLNFGLLNISNYKGKESPAWYIFVNASRGLEIP